MRAILSQAKPAVARVLGMCETDPAVIDYINEAQQRLITRGKWVGTTVKYRVCVNDGCLTWPRQVEAIEAYALCCSPGIIRNQWYEFAGNGPGLVDEDSCIGNQMVDQGEGFCTFDDIHAVTHKLRVQSTVAESTNQFLIVQGYDAAGVWIRTLDGTTYIDGEKIPISTTVQTSVNIFSRVTGVIKPPTNGNIKLYDYDPVGLTQVLIGDYEPDEEIPNYRRSLIPSLPAGPFEQCDGTTSDRVKITIMAKLKYIPAVNDNDFLLIGNIPALKDMVQSIKKAENDRMNDAKDFEMRALSELDRELGNWQGTGTVPTLRVINPGIFGAGAVENVI